MSLKELGKLYYNLIKQNRKRDLTEEKGIITYDRLIMPFLAQYPTVLADVEIEWVKESPYANEWELRLAVSYGRVKMQWYDESNTPAITDPLSFSIFRAAHDVLHHVHKGFSFSPFDEYRAAQDLMPVYQDDPLAQAFVYSNVAAMNAVYEWSPSRWHKLSNKTDCLCLCPTYHTLTPHRTHIGNV